MADQLGGDLPVDEGEEVLQGGGCDQLLQQILVRLQLLPQGHQLVGGEIEQGFALQGLHIDAVPDLVDGGIRLPALAQGGGEGLGGLRVVAADGDEHAFRELLEFLAVGLIQLFIALSRRDQVQAAGMKLKLRCRHQEGQDRSHHRGEDHADGMSHDDAHEVAIPFVHASPHHR